MSNRHTSTLPDTVYGAADINTSDPHRLITSVTADTTVLIHAWVGGIYLAMTERNWRALFNAVNQLEVPVTRTHVIRMDDSTGTATITTVTA